MNWSNVKLILLRELKDQLRDRRTLFMIAVLPLLLYPFMGMAFLQVAQFMQEAPARIQILGSESLPEEPKLIDDDQFSDDLKGDATFEITIPTTSSEQDLAEIEAIAKDDLTQGRYDAIVSFPKNFAEQLQAYRVGDSKDPPQPQIFYSSAKDRSRIAYIRLSGLLEQWRGKIVEQTLVEKDVSVSAASPFVIGDQDLSEVSRRKAAIWSKILPFIIIVWALTGAFYPAIDLCAGEKERGTLETLLSSPAERNEIVWGKLFTVMIFSAATSLLNLASMIVTSTIIVSRIVSGGSQNALEFGAPPLNTVGWLVLAILPLSALFSALSLALAAMARSSKEGQYYLMPLMLITMPLAMIPIMPSTEISLGNCLIPITGIMLLLKSLMEGDFLTAVKFAVPVVTVTAICCLFAIRWAVHQFNDESVLFRENERFELGAWLVHLVRDRRETPSVADAFMCGVLILIITFFGRLWMPIPTNWNGFMVSTIVLQLAFVLTPTLLMTLVLTSNRRRTLLFNLPSLSNVLMAFMLAFFLHPSAVQFANLLQDLYPISDQTKAQLSTLNEIIGGASVWQLLLVMAIVPGICEEIAFRGFILSGLRRLGSRSMAIIISSVFFGVTHGMLQQSISATILGCVIGFLAVQSRSIFTCMVFHMTHNGLQLLSAIIFSSTFLKDHPGFANFIQTTDEGFAYKTSIVVLSILMTSLVFYWFRRLPFQQSEEERLQTKLEKQSVRASSHVVC